MITTVIAYVLGSNDEGSKLESLTKFIEETLIGRHQRSLTIGESLWFAVICRVNLLCCGRSPMGDPPSMRDFIPART
jgi:hypothetical protein